MAAMRPIRAEPTRLVVAWATVLMLSAGCATSASLAPSPPSTSGTVVTATPTTAPTARPVQTNPPDQMTHGRSFQTATALIDARVLVAGGYYNRRPIDSVNLYDPATDTFTSTGSQRQARGFDTATRLADGRVLLVGGDSAEWNFDGPYIASAEVYDPMTGTFGPTGSMATGRNLHTATRLLDGRILIAGGDGRGTISLASAELYDPAAGSFGPTGPMVAARGFQTATRLADGRVLITGGTSDGWAGAHFLASAEIYDPKTGKFNPTGPMTTRRGSHTATLLPDGRVLIVGGSPDGATSLASAEVYNPKTGKFKVTGSMAAARTFQESTLLADGRVLVTGGDPAGWVYDGPFLASAEIYDPRTGMFTATGSMADTLTNHSATLLPDGRVLIAGGYNGKTDVADAELFDPTSGTFL